MQELFSTTFLHIVTRITINPEDNEAFATSGMCYNNIFYLSILKVHYVYKISF